MIRALALLVLVLLSVGCAQGARSTDALLRDLRTAGHNLVDARGTKSTIENELNDLNDAMATNVPVPKLVQELEIDGVRVDLFWCPGRAEQAEAVTAFLVGGVPPKDARYLDVAADAVSGRGFVTPFEDHLFAITADKDDEAAVLALLRTLARLAAD